jgi:predicted enzyme related to lactoylglutathione lyase
VVEVSVSLLAVIVDCHDPRRQAEWWAQVLAYEVNQRNPDEFQVSDPAGAGRLLYFMKVPEPKVGKNRLHLDLVTPGSMEAEVARLVGAGAQVVEVRQDPASYDNPDTFTVMRDPEGNEFCVTSTSTLTSLASCLDATSGTCDGLQTADLTQPDSGTHALTLDRLDVPSPGGSCADPPGEALSDRREQAPRWRRSACPGR